MCFKNHPLLIMYYGLKNGVKSRNKQEKFPWVISIEHQSTEYRCKKKIKVFMFGEPFFIKINETEIPEPVGSNFLKDKINRT